MFEGIINSSDYRFNPHAIPLMAAGILIFIIGVFIFLQTKKTIKNVSFFFFCISLSLWLIPSSFVYLSNNPQTALWWYKHFVFLGVANIMPNFYMFSVATAGFLKRQRYAVAAGFIVSNLFYILVVTTDKFISTPLLYFWGYYPHYLPPIYLFFIPYAMLFLTSEINLWLAYQMERVPIKRTHILTIFVGLLIGFMASFDFVAKIWTVPLYPFGYIPSFILSSIVAYSIIRHKAFDIETVIHKTILWIASFSIIVIPIILLYQWSFPIIKDSALAQLIFGIMSFIVFAVYLRVIQPKIDHFFQRRKANLDEISSQFIADVGHLKSFEKLIDRIEGTIAQAFYPQWIDVFIYDEKKKDYGAINKARVHNKLLRFKESDEFLWWLTQKNKIVYREFVGLDPDYTTIQTSAMKYFEATQAVLAIPLVVNDRLLGFINLGKKSNLTRYNAVDLNFLTTLKNQAAIAVSNSLIYQSIEEQVKERSQELVEVQKQLIQAEKLATVGTLSGGVAHEINNPLTAILTNVQMLLAFHDEKSGSDRESLELIEEATQRCRTIVQKLMTYAKKPLEAAEFVKVDLNEVIKKAISFISYQLEQDNVHVKVSAPDGPYIVFGNPNELEQVVTNLVLNARDAILQVKKGGEIQIHLSKDDKSLRLEVKDEGCGMPEDVIRKIFDPFFTTKDVGKGLGLGLSICQSIVEKYKGRISAQSAEGRGSTFRVEFFK